MQQLLMQPKNHNGKGEAMIHFPLGLYNPHDKILEKLYVCLAIEEHVRQLSFKHDQTVFGFTYDRQSLLGKLLETMGDKKQ